jgi:hypothetical protein
MASPNDLVGLIGPALSRRESAGDRMGGIPTLFSTTIAATGWAQSGLEPTSPVLLARRSPACLSATTKPLPAPAVELHLKTGRTRFDVNSVYLKTGRIVLKKVLAQVWCKFICRPAAKLWILSRIALVEREFREPRPTTFWKGFPSQTVSVACGDPERRGCTNHEPEPF